MNKTNLTIFLCPLGVMPVLSDDALFSLSFVVAVESALR